MQIQPKSAPLYNPKRLLRYTPEEIEHCERSQTIKKYIAGRRIQSMNTGITHKTRMQTFSQFVFVKFDKMEVDRFIEDLKAGAAFPKFAPSKCLACWLLFNSIWQEKLLYYVLFS